METINSTPTLNGEPISSEPINTNRFEILKIPSSILNSESKNSSPDSTNNDSHLNVANNNYNSLKMPSSNSSLRSNSPLARKNITFSDVNQQTNGSCKINNSKSMKRENSFTKSILKNSDTETRAGHSDSDFDFDDTRPLNRAKESIKHTSNSTRMPSVSNHSSLTSDGSNNGKKQFYIKYNPDNTQNDTHTRDTHSKPLKLTSLFNKQSSKDDLDGQADKDDLLDKQEQSENDTNIKDENKAKQLKKSFKLKYNEQDKTIECSFKNDLLSQFKTISLYQALVAEFLATTLLLMFVCSVGLPIDDMTHTDLPAAINGCLGSGLFVSTLVWGFGHISGANLNPAVTLALFATGETNLIRAIAYILSQLAGASFGSYLIKELVPDHIKFIEIISRQERQLMLNQTTSIISPTISSFTSLPIGVTLLDKSITPVQGFGVEVICTFILMLTVFACLDTKRTDLNGSFPLTIGFAITIGGLFGGPLTGGSMNPARSFGPALIMDSWDNHWIYWAGPICGALLSAFVYKLLVFNTKKRSYTPVDTRDKSRDIEMQDF